MQCHSPGRRSQRLWGLLLMDLQLPDMRLGSLLWVSLWRQGRPNPSIPKPQVTWGRRQLCRLPTPSPPISPPSPAAQGCVPLAVEPLQGQRPHRRIGQPVRCSPTCTNGKGIGDVSFSFLVLQVMPIASAPSSSDQLWPRGRCGCALVTVGHVWQALS